MGWTTQRKDQNVKTVGCWTKMFEEGTMNEVKIIRLDFAQRTIFKENRSRSLMVRYITRVVQKTVARC